MTHKAICYDDEGRLECCCELRDRGWVTYLRTFKGGPIYEETTTPGNSGQVQKLTDAGRSEAIRLRHTR